MRTKPQAPRGIRNNNPLNIRVGNVWLGERPNPTDGQFEEFVSMKYGLRAAFVILRRYIRRYHHDTIRTIISTWAPSNENATDNYISIVSQRTGIDPDDRLTYEDKESMVKLVAAMAFVECGTNLNFDVISDAYDNT